VDSSSVAAIANPFASGAGAVTIAGTGSAGFSGDPGAASSAELDSPSGIAIDSQGDLFIADSDNCRVREVPAHSGTQFLVPMVRGHIYTVAGGACGTKEDKIGFPSSVAVDTSGDLFIADPSGDTVFELPANSGEQFGKQMTAGKLAAVAGTGTPGEALNDSQSGLEQASREGLSYPQGVGVDSEGDLFIADAVNCDVIEVASHDGVQWGMPMHAGSSYRIAGTGVCGQSGDGGIGTDAELWDPVDVAVGPAGDLLVSDAGAEEVLDLALQTGDYYGVHIRADHMEVVAGIGSYGPYLIDGLPATGQTAELNSPTDIAVSASGDLLVSDTYSSCIREIPSINESERGIHLVAGDMYTLAGSLPAVSGGAETNSVGTSMLYPVGIAVGAGGSVFYSDEGANVVRELSSGV
jgi:hypothetical protein